MLIDNPMTLRKKILKSFSMPEDEDILVYNANFLHLVDKDVEDLYGKYYTQYIEKNDKYTELTNKLNEYDEFLSNAKLINENLSEQEHIKKIQELETEYNRKYGNIKSVEKKLQMYENRILQQNFKIAQKMQEQEDFFQKEKQRKIYELNDTHIKIGQYETYIQFFKDFAKDHKLLIEMLEKEKARYEEMFELAEKEADRCRECRTRRYPAAKTINTNIEKIQQRIDEHNRDYELAVDKKKEYKYQLKRAQVKALELTDEIKLSESTYAKKSPEVLQLEGVKFGLIEDMGKAQEELEALIGVQSKEFKLLKDKIKAYRDSLNNLLQMQKMSSEIGNLKELQAQYREQLDLIIPKLNLLTQFIDVKHKVFEDRLNGMFDGRIKFKFFELEDYAFREVCEMKFDNVDVSFLTQEQAKEMNQLIVSRFRYID